MYCAKSKLNCVLKHYVYSSFYVKAEEAFKALTEAYERLVDPTLQAKYVASLCGGRIHLHGTNRRHMSAAELAEVDHQLLFIIN